MQTHVHAAALEPLSLEAPRTIKASTQAVKKALGLMKDKAPNVNPTKPPPAEVPADFDANLLPPLDTSSAKALEDTAPIVFLYRWLQLRSEVSSAGSFDQGWQHLGSQCHVCSHEETCFNNPVRLLLQCCPESLVVAQDCCRARDQDQCYRGRAVARWHAVLPCPC